MKSRYTLRLPNRARRRKRIRRVNTNKEDAAGDKGRHRRCRLIYAMDWINCWICLRSSEDEYEEVHAAAAVLAIFNAARNVQGRGAAREEHPYCDLCFGSQGLEQFGGQPVFADVRAHCFVAFSRGDHFQRKS